MKMKISLVVSIFLNLVMIACILYLMTVASIPKTRTDKVGLVKRNIRIYKDKPTGTMLSCTDEKSYYPSGSLKYRGISINSQYISFISYSQDGKILGEIIGGDGRLIIPDKDGNISPIGTTAPFYRSNCYYRLGEPITKKEFLRREKLVDDEIKKAFEYTPSHTSGSKDSIFSDETKEALKRGRRNKKTPHSGTRVD